MAEKITTIIVSLIGLVVLAALVGSVAMVGLAATGDVGEANGCRNDTADASGAHEVRGVNSDAALADAWQAKWSEFDSKLDAGQSASVSFTESESTSRAVRYLQEKDAPITNLIICFHDGVAEASGNVDLPVLGDLPGVGGAFDSNVLVRGTVDLSGANPTIQITNVEAGNLPGDAAEQLMGSIEDVVNGRLDDLNLQHKMTVNFSEGSVEISGTP